MQNYPVTPDQTANLTTHPASVQASASLFLRANTVREDMGAVLALRRKLWLGTATHRGSAPMSAAGLHWARDGRGTGPTMAAISGPRMAAVFGPLMAGLTGPVMAV